MNLREVVSNLQADAQCVSEQLDSKVTGAYCSDLLSDVMANAQKGDLWITIQTHQNIVAVASLLELAGIVITRGANPDADTLAKAAQEKIPIVTTELPSFEVAGRMYCLLGRDK
ncbi:MAG TPA: DRTGG domain-containing protein [Bacillota bacterium]|nr:DRTGG domain-containing protein [Bacillota bacterium]